MNGVDVPFGVPLGAVFQQSWTINADNRELIKSWDRRLDSTQYLHLGIFVAGSKVNSKCQNKQTNKQTMCQNKNRPKPYNISPKFELIV